ncbi:hypothetical protein Agub_g5753 [Astrephomene gubernaculifera]|uniref:Uncharacterized protein n=1 Tax=Astrephomene gubernaculifera TaxID=47775 RepID=A0AAD3DM96_9CHLO|nr:hypothetical protein Agub_g5753 [Astrephomene gubernaculifera]
MQSTISSRLGTSSRVLPAALPVLSAGIRVITWHVHHGCNARRAALRCIATYTSANGSPAGALPHSGPASTRLQTASYGALQSSRLCRITGLCSRTNIKIVNTNMRCPTCLVDNASSDDPSTMFPAVTVDQTVKLLHHQSSQPSDDELSASVLSGLPSNLLSNIKEPSFSPSLSRPVIPRGFTASSPLTAPQQQPNLQASNLGAAAAAITTILIYRARASAMAVVAAFASRLSASTTLPSSTSPHATRMTHFATGSTVALPSNPWELAFGAYRTLCTAPRRPSFSDATTKTEIGTGAAVDEAKPATAPTGVVAVLRAWFRRTRGRAEGISRKFLFRTLNKRIIRQMARRATIGLPIVGFFFVARLLVKDFERVRAEAAAGRKSIAGLFSVALACDAVDLVSQALLLAGMAHSHYGLGLGVAAEWLAAADHSTVAMAVTSFTAGVTGELLTVLREERQQQQQCGLVGELGRQDMKKD